MTCITPAARGRVGISSPTSCSEEANGGGGRGRKRPFLWVSSLCMACQDTSPPPLPEGLPLSPLTPIPMPCSGGCGRERSPGDGSRLCRGMQNKSLPDGTGATLCSLRGGWLSTASFSSSPCSNHPCALGQDGLHFQENSWKSPLFSTPPQELWSCSHSSWAVTFVLLGLV